MGLETGTWVDDLVNTNPVSSDIRGQGDDHLRLIKSVLKNTFPRAGKAFRFPTTSSKTDDFTVASSEENTLFIVDCTAEDITVTLPTLDATLPGWHVTFVKIDSSSNVIDIDGTINNDSNGAIVTSEHEYLYLEWTGAEWIGIAYMPVNGNGVGVPRGTTAQRPANAVAGTLRFNTTTGGFEGYNGTTWASAKQPLIQPQGYLTLTSNTPVLAASVAAGGTIYYTLFKGNLLPIYDGVDFILHAIAQLELTLNNPNHVAGGIYDIYGFLDGTTVRIGTGPVWTTVTLGSGARGTGAGTTELERFNGLWVNKVAITLRNGSTTYGPIDARKATLLGTYYNDSGAAGSCTCVVGWSENSVWGLYNVYNKTLIEALSGDSTSSWSAGAGPRQLNGSSQADITMISGLPEQRVRVAFQQRVNSNSSNSNFEFAAGIGVNVTNSFSGTVGYYQNVNSAGDHTQRNLQNVNAWYNPAPFIGATRFNALENAINGAVTLSGSETACRLSAMWEG